MTSVLLILLFRAQRETVLLDHRVLLVLRGRGVMGRWWTTSLDPQKETLVTRGLLGHQVTSPMWMNLLVTLESMVQKERKEPVDKKVKIVIH